jgi:hypothetical protein
MKLRSSKIVTYIPQTRERIIYNNNNSKQLLYCILVLFIMCVFTVTSIVVCIVYII